MADVDVAEVAGDSEGVAAGAGSEGAAADVAAGEEVVGEEGTEADVVVAAEDTSSSSLNGSISNAFTARRRGACARTPRPC